MISCSLVGNNRRFGGTSAQNMEAADSSKAVVTAYHTLLCHDAEDCNLTRNYTFLFKMKLHQQWAE
jgi:hypothetical protein